MFPLEFKHVSVCLVNINKKYNYKKWTINQVEHKATFADSGFVSFLIYLTFKLPT